MNENDSAPPVPQTAREISKEWLDIIRGLRVELLSPAYDPQWKNGQTWILDELLRRLDEPLVAPSDPLENATQDVAAPSVGELEGTRIAEIRERLSKATPGPWRVSPRGGDAEQRPWVDNEQYDVARMDHVAGVMGEPSYAREDADFIAHAPDDIEFLLQRILSGAAE